MHLIHPIQAWHTDTFVTNYLPLVAFPVVYFTARLYFKSPLISPKDMDFVTGIAEIEADDEIEEPPKNRIEAAWRNIVSYIAELHSFSSDRPT